LTFPVAGIAARASYVVVVALEAAAKEVFCPLDAFMAMKRAVYRELGIIGFLGLIKGT